ncbi:MAG: Gfo/Idh/MocA family oxidoreductase [Planctomycetota bacterium]|nr:Gfo/Idh/MocA family oxidoreductase [Planctomycetota bacterium]
MKTIRWGIIGVGDVTEVKSGPGFRKASNSSLVAVMRRDGARAKDYAERHGVPRWYDDASKLIVDPEVDAIYIATPPNVHKEYTTMAAEAGKPVYVEKPMALSFAECQDMIAACKAADVRLWVAHYRRKLAKFEAVKALIDDGKLGRIDTATRECQMPLMETGASKLPWRVIPEIAGGGKFVDLASHTFDLLDFLLGPIAQVQGAATNRGGAYPAEDNVVAHFQFESGVTGCGNWCFTGSQHIDRLVISGNKGQVEFSVFDDNSIQLRDPSGAIEEIHHPFPEHVQQPMIQSIVDEINGTDRCPSTGEDASRTTRVMETILAGYYS